MLAPSIGFARGGRMAGAVSFGRHSAIAARAQPTLSRPGRNDPSANSSAWRGCRDSLPSANWGGLPADPNRPCRACAACQPRKRRRRRRVSGDNRQGTPPHQAFPPGPPHFYGWIFTMFPTRCQEGKGKNSCSISGTYRSSMRTASSKSSGFGPKLGMRLTWSTWPEQRRRLTWPWWWMRGGMAKGS